MIATGVYNQQAETSHWWFRARRKLLRDTLKAHLRQDAILGRSAPWRDSKYPWDAKNAAFAHLLEIGCGAGGNLETLAAFGRTIGIDPSPMSVAMANAGRAHHRAIGGDATHMIWNDESFHAVIALDVLEHIDDDGRALCEAYRVLRPGGVLIATVPAMPSLWGPHDEGLDHKRRYTRQELHRKAITAGFHVHECRYTMALLMPLLVLHRHALKAPWHRRAAYRNPADRVPPKPVNTLMEGIMDAERIMGGAGVRWPLGASLLLVAKRR